MNVARAAGRARRGFIPGPPVLVKRLPDPTKTAEFEAVLDRNVALVAENTALASEVQRLRARLSLAGVS